MGDPSGLIDNGLRQVIKGLSPRNSGRFYNYDVSEIPW